MSATDNQTGKNKARYALNLTLAAVAGQVGCLTLVIVVAALFGGLWLDAHFGTRPKITIALMILSVPITIVSMFWVVRKATSHLTIESKTNSQQPQEDAQRGRDS